MGCFKGAARAAVIITFLFTVVAAASAADFKSAKECVVGSQVQDRENKVGTIVKVEQVTMCRVRFADGKETSYLFWMLRSAGASTLTDDKLVKGKYECFGSGHYLFMDLYIDGPNTYHDNSGKSGRYTLDPKTGRIVFESGSFSSAKRAQLLRGPSIGMNADGGSFYATTCELNKH